MKEGNRMKKPVIGLVPAYDPDRKQCFLRPQYAKAILNAGGLPFVLPLTYEEDILEDITDLYDGFLFTGGADISPSLYGEEPLPCTGRCVCDREAMEKGLLEAALKKGKPVLGICRGMQFLNVAMGGSLYQDLLAFHPEAGDHWQKEPYETCFHANRIFEGTPLHQAVQVSTLRVNSMHHQGIKHLASSLAPMAVSEDGVIEAVYAPDYDFVWGVQWHPEFLCGQDECHARIFEALVQAADRARRTDHGQKDHPASHPCMPSYDPAESGSAFSS